MPSTRDTIPQLPEEEPTHVSVVGPRRLKRPMRAHAFEVLDGPPALRGRQLLLDRPRLRLGRASDADLRIESEELSRHHAELTRRDGEFQVRDLDSRNGVYLNGLQIHSAVLRDGDQLALGDVVLLYREGA